MYTNLNNPVNYQLQGFGQNGVRTISTDQLYIQGEYYRVLVAEEDSYVTAVSVLGDDLTAEFVYAGTTIYGLFTEVSVSSGSLTAYIAGPTDIEDVWAYINEYGQTNAATIEAADCAKDAIAPLLDKYYAKASLVMVPSLYKTSIVYSERPLTTDGQLAFTRSNDTATRVGPDGYIEKVRTNLALYSEDFTNAAWAKINSATATGDTTTAPNGTTTADTITGGGSSSTSRVRQSFAFVAGVEYAISIYVKANDSLVGRFATLNGGGTTRTSVTFTNTAGVVAISGSSGGGTTDIESVGSGWYRISHQIVINDQTTLDFFPDINGTNLSWYAWGAMIETGVLTPYIGPTLGTGVSVGPVANLPRLNYPINSDGSVGCPSLLLEPQRTNLVTFSEQFDNAAWIKFNTTISANVATSPDGYTNADKLIDNTTLATHGADRTINITGVHTFSVFAKASESSVIALQVQQSSVTSNYALIYYDLISGQVESGEFSTSLSDGTIQEIGNGWYRCTITYTPITAGNHSVRFFLAKNIGGNKVDYVGNGTDGVFLYGCQLEAGAYATSYIPTLGAAVTRGADACSKTGISSLIGQTEGTLFLEMNINKRVNLSLTGPNGLEIKDASGNNVIIIGTAYGSNQVFSLARRNAGSFSTLILTTNNALGTYKLAAAYSSAGFVFYVNGVQIGTSATLPPSATFADIGLMQVFGANNAEGELVNQALLFKTRLTNQELQDLTTL